MTDEDLRTAAQHSIHHRAEIERSHECCCFYCMAIFQPRDIVKWTDGDDTAICPRCSVDAVIGDASGLPVGNLTFMVALYHRAFDRYAIEHSTDQRRGSRPSESGCDPKSDLEAD